MQSSPDAQPEPQAPLLLQYAALASRFTHVPPQLVWPDAHVVPHAPAEHGWPPGQTFPQSPQLALSVAVLTHTPLQSVSPETQPVPQPPGSTPDQEGTRSRRTRS